MATIKSFSDLEQSRKLAEILPLESADMTYIGSDLIPYPYCESKFKGMENVHPAWSLAALLAFLPNSAFLERGSSTELYRITLPVELVPFDWFVEPVDACYEMIIRLNELKML